MAAYDEEGSRLSYGKELPPITLSTTSISSLVSLVPVLVAMTSRSQTPCFDNEKDKPAWWPEDIQWKNPKHYSAYMGDNILKILRKVVKSCYSYHGVEDLLCRLDETPIMLDLSADTMEIEGDTSPDIDGPVYVCCFCLEEFSSHEKVSAHQRLCQDKSQETNGLSADSQIDSIVQNVHSVPISQLKLDEKIDFPHPVSLSAVQYDLSHKYVTVDVQDVRKSASTAPSSKGAKKKTSSASSSSSSSSSKRQTPTSAVVPILKTRSQKKLDQIMERHSKKLLMIKECRELKEVPKYGAWWVRKQRQRRLSSFTVTTAVHHPSELLTKHEFLCSLGLSLKVKVEHEQIKSCKKEVDLDCEIICVEGPLSMKPPLPAVENSNNATSPRASRSLMSQMSRDDSSSRRRISFCFVEDEWADKEALDEGRDPRQMCLLTLDLSSPLGQRIKKYVKADGQMNVVKDAEVYCHTEMRDDSKLRVRSHDFKVTFRRKCRATSHVHMYKFNRYQIWEFKKRLKTGLSVKSRNLQKRLPRSKVLLRQLTDRDIELYNEEKKVTIAENIVVDDDLCITQIDIPEANIKPQSRPSTILSSFNNPSTQPPRPVRPPYRQSSSSYTPIRPPPRHYHPQKQHQSRHLPYPRPQHTLHRPTSSASTNSRGPLPFSLSHQQSNSPPHIPNIFRNRANSNTPSPPRIVPRRDSGVIKPPLPSSTIPHSKVDERKNSHSDFKKTLTSLSNHHSTHNHHQQHQQPHPVHADHRHHQLNHHQNRQQQQESDHSPALGFSAGVIISERRQKRPGLLNNYRRKQPMNQVRHDDSLDKIQHTQRSPHRPKESKNFINLSNSIPVSNKSQNNDKISSSQRPASSPSSLLAMKNAQRLQDELLCVGNNKNKIKNSPNSPREISQLSNFEYFSIKQGKILSGHSLSRNNKNSPTQGNTPVSKSHSCTSSNESSTPLFSYSPPSLKNVVKTIPSLRTPQQQQSPTNIVCTNNQQSLLRQQHQPSTNNVNGSSSNQKKQANGPLIKHSSRPTQLSAGAPQRSTSLPSFVNKSNTNQSPTIIDIDDDVMEVICIDD